MRIVLVACSRERGAEWRGWLSMPMFNVRVLSHIAIAC
jgi:hypothetical protein